MEVIIIKKCLALCTHLFKILSFHCVLFCMVSTSNQQNYHVNLYIKSLLAAFKIFLFIMNFIQFNHGVPWAIFFMYILLGVY